MVLDSYCSRMLDESQSGQLCITGNIFGVYYLAGFKACRMHFLALSRCALSSASVYIT
jgi:hypothetical protein